MALMGYPSYALGPAGTASIVLTSVENGSEAEQSFQCTGRIHGYIRLSQPTLGPHRLESRWLSPSGRLVAHSENSLDFKTPHSTAYVWMDFPERRSGLLGTVDPELEQNQLSYSGTWTLQVLWDGKPQLMQSFEVRCP